MTGPLRDESERVDPKQLAALHHLANPPPPTRTGQPHPGVTTFNYGWNGLVLDG